MNDEALASGKVADAPSDNWVYKLLPQKAWPYAQLARWDRPIGWQLLLWPCLWSATLAASVLVKSNPDFHLLIQALVFHCLLFTVGAIAMRGAGCTFNDLVDHKLDAKVERTRSRPLPAGRISRKQTRLFIFAQVIVGALVVLQFNWFTIFLSIASLVIVAIYPFAKRFTDWPQFVLGLAFSWGALVGWAAVFEEVSWTSISLYIAAVCWTVGYDTIYAHQDRDDDALIGVRSTARLFGDKTKSWLMVLYGLTLLFLTLSFMSAGVGLVVYFGLLVASILFIWQIRVLDIDDGDQCLALFKSNSKIGLAIFLSLLAGLFLS
ncbi:4-hydroxybenzoate octaprenyltransferase [Lentilitoribacter sp. Alg239-R112]|jgi:4-hydroxybenzoate polyprenyltransferase|uniref:4-hydroxybenzoate octaprenyltransferase n=1 Tax=Lentilitoribacter sp. Alg239-R112 TaxID=2305987 RepID=UPI0013A6F126|nr:4-hydroxybenzoate octaprenyltransferase [Lentilitoribacter sp. Alg239-R112]